MLWALQGRSRFGFKWLVSVVMRLMGLNSDADDGSNAIVLTNRLPNSG